MSNPTVLSQRDGALGRAAQHVSAARHDLTALQRALGGQIASLGARWSGQGATSFHSLHRAWQEKQARITAALDDFERSLVDTDRDNMATDQAAADAASRYRARLG